MGRIRTIKPEFPQSESIGSLSRDARLLFIQLFTLADDEGRLRGASRMLASLLYPYDEDVPALIGGWLEELDGKGHISRYSVGENSYVQINKFLEHQKIDKPSKSKLPPFANPREEQANTLEPLATDQVSGIKDQGVDQGADPQAQSAETPEPVLEEPKKPAEEIPEGMTAIQYANGVLESASVPASYKLQVKTADTLEFLARDENCALNVAAGRLLERMMGRAEQRGKSSLWFWLEDGGWKKTEGVSTEGWE